MDQVNKSAPQKICSVHLHVSVFRANKNSKSIDHGEEPVAYIIAVIAKKVVIVINMIRVRIQL